MPKNRYALQKLVRDSAVENMRAKGAEVEFSTLDNDAFRHHLVQKLIEETHEVAGAQSDEELVEELADVLEIIKNLAQTVQVSTETVEAMRQKRNAARGGFSKRHYVHHVDCPLGSYWDDYFGKDPVTYHLVKPKK